MRKITKKKLIAAWTTICPVFGLLTGFAVNTQTVKADEDITTGTWMITPDGFYLRATGRLDPYGVETLEITKYTGESSYPTLPTKWVEHSESSTGEVLLHKVYPVVGIADGAFSDRDDLIGVHFTNELLNDRSKFLNGY